jgi:hypothetical protein
MNDVGRRARSVATLVGSLLVATMAVALPTAAAHGGSTALVHSCTNPSGNVKLVGANDACKANEQAVDWPAIDTNTTYGAGSGLALSAGNVFSVTGAPWSGLTGVPAGFADGVDNVGNATPNWSDLVGVPADLLDGDDDGSAAVAGLKTELATSDGTPNQSTDLVSFTKIKDLTALGDGQITTTFIRDGTLLGADIAAGAITTSKLDGDAVTSAKIDDGAVGEDDLANDAVTSAKIDDGTIQSADFAPGVLDTSIATDTIDPPVLPAGSRTAVTYATVAFPLKTSDVVVVSPPAGLDPGVVYAGSDVLTPGILTIYLHNITTTAIDPVGQTWTIRALRTLG